MTKEEIHREIDNITSQIIKKYQPDKIILFGSAARGESHTDSDLDFLIIKKGAAHLGRDRMRDIYKLVDKNMAADFLVYLPEEVENGLKWGDPFLKEVMHAGKVLYG